jgi:hypothetical protein
MIEQTAAKVAFVGVLAVAGAKRGFAPSFSAQVRWCEHGAPVVITARSFPLPGTPVVWALPLPELQRARLPQPV